MHEVWAWLKSKIIFLDISLTNTTDYDILSLKFPKGLRENAILWIIGVYIETIEKEVVMKGSKIDIDLMKGIYKHRKQSDKYLAMPELGFISDFDQEAQGIG